MSRQQLISFLKRELSIINEQIDFMILQGRPYRSLSAKHRALIQQISKVHA